MGEDPGFQIQGRIQDSASGGGSRILIRMQASFDPEGENTKPSLGGPDRVSSYVGKETRTETQKLA